MTVTIGGESYELTAPQKQAWDELVRAHVDPLQALQIATESYEDLEPAPPEEVP